jgi:CCR4-NOT transcriptional regulation complex NOT5 subunit
MTTTNEVRNMIKPWLTGNDEKDAKMLKNMFRGVGMSISEWRQVVKETKAEA